jgi:hypothetical protein
MRGTKRFTVGALFVGAMLAGSVAFAAWTATGSGSGYARATNAQVLTTLDASAITPPTLYPGAIGDVVLEIDNPNPYPVTVTDVEGSGAIDSDAGGACDTNTGVTFTDRSGLTLNVPASGSVVFTLSGAVAMDNTSDTTCQGAVFTIPVTLTGLSNA